MISLSDVTLVTSTILQVGHEAFEHANTEGAGGNPFNGGGFGNPFEDIFQNDVRLF